MAGKPQAGQTTRRDFMKTSLGAGMGFWVAGGFTPSISRAANEQIQFACIGVGGKGRSDTMDAGRHGQVVAFCDVDKEQIAGCRTDFERNNLGAKMTSAQDFSDFREMIEKLGDKIDAVTVSTPDHTHAPSAVMAMRRGKHAFVQKPLTWSIEEARLMRQLTNEKKLVTQMGNQGTADSGLREGAEILKSGALGELQEVHCWTNRPVWPQGIKRPEGSDPIPDTLNWDAFLGPAPERPYKKGVYHRFNWRGWLDFGTDALGDMACHTLNVAFMALDMENPETIETIDSSGVVDNETYPLWSYIKFNYPARNGNKPFTFTWYSGGDRLPQEHRHYLKPIINEYVDEQKKRAEAEGRQYRAPGSGLLIIGSKGAFYSPNDYGAQHVLLPRADFANYKKPEPTIPRSPGHFKEFADAIHQGDPKMPLSNFDYAGRLTETILLGTLALKVGKPIHWKHEEMKADDLPEADQYIRRDYRSGWGLDL